MSRLDTVIQNINRDYKDNNLITKGIQRATLEKIPFSSSRANYMLYGGIPRGKLIEFAGEENGGKTTTALDICANAQKLFEVEYSNEITELKNIQKPNKSQSQQLTNLENRGPLRVVYADCENTLDEEWAKTLGVNVDDMYIMQPKSQSAEEIFDMLLELINTEEVGLCVIDSLGVMLSQLAYDKDMTEKTYGGISSALTLFSKKAEMVCARTGCTLIGINQMRDDLNSTFSRRITTGGRAWKHNCSLRLMFQKGDYLDFEGNTLRRSAEEIFGNQVMISVEKNKVCKPDRRSGFYTLMYDYGIDKVADLVEVAMKYNIIVKSGAWFNLIDPETGEIICEETGEEIKIQGKVNLINYLKENEVLLQEITDLVNDLILE